MFPSSYRKFWIILGLCLVLGLGIMTLTEGDSGSGMSGMAVGNAAEGASTGSVAAGTIGGIGSVNWVMFFFGAAMAGILLGLIVYLFKVEKNEW